MSVQQPTIVIRLTPYPQACGTLITVRYAHATQDLFRHFIHEGDFVESCTGESLKTFLENFIRGYADPEGHIEFTGLRVEEVPEDVHPSPRWTTPCG